MLNIVPSVQVCDATKFNSSIKARLKKTTNRKLQTSYGTKIVFKISSIIFSAETFSASAS